MTLPNTHAVFKIARAFIGVRASARNTTLLATMLPTAKRLESIEKVREQKSGLQTKTEEIAKLRSLHTVALVSAVGKRNAFTFNLTMSRMTAKKTVR